MTDDTVIERNVKAFRELAQVNGWAIVAESEIQSGYELRVQMEVTRFPSSYIQPERL